MADEAGVDVILVGDSLANVVLGLASTREVGMTQMLHHTKAVVRAVKKAMIVGDMPYGSYEKSFKLAVSNAKKFMNAGCHAVKLEWFDGCIKTVEALVKAGIPVMGHVGLTPQSATEMKVQGKDAIAAKKIIQHSLELQKAKAFSIVLECIPKELATKISSKLKIPTIGIGAGNGCDGQVLVSYDLLGLFNRYQPKFTKKYVNLSPLIIKAFKQYGKEVRQSCFPDDAHSFHMLPQELKKL
jgi:3-methyl-2-oxobutanoate hydroxymethyltransferase